MRLGGRFSLHDPSTSKAGPPPLKGEAKNARSI